MNTTPTPGPALKVVRRCPKCAVGYVIPTSKDGRFFTFRETVVNLPMSVYIPTCWECGSGFPTAEVQEEIKQVLEADYQRHAPAVARALERLRRRKGIN